MKNLIKYLAETACVAAIAAYGQMASAHTWNNSLGEPAGATDIWLVTCTTGDNAKGRLEVSVKNVTPSSPLLSVHISKGGQTVSGTDAVSGDANYSPTIALTQGDGGYAVTLDKAGAGALNYSMEYHCKTGSGLHTGDDTSIDTIQDDGNTSPPPSDNIAGAIGTVFKINSSGTQYCPGFKPAKFSPSKDIDLWLQIDSETQMTVYSDSGLTVPVAALYANFDSIASTSASFDAFYFGDSDNRFEAIGVLKFNKKDGSVKSLKATFLRKGVLNSCYANGTMTGKRVN